MFSATHPIISSSSPLSFSSSKKNHHHTNSIHRNLERDPHEPVAAQVLREVRGRLRLLLDGRRRRVHEAASPVPRTPAQVRAGRPAANRRDAHLHADADAGARVGFVATAIVYYDDIAFSPQKNIIVF